MLIIVILLVMSAASKLVDIASKLDWYSEAKTVAEMLVLNLKIEDSFANQCSHDVYVYKHRIAL